MVEQGHERFRSRLEHAARQAPGRYTAALVALAVLAHASMVAALAALVWSGAAALAWLVGVPFDGAVGWWAAAGAAVLALRLTRVPETRVEGHAITADQAPALHALLASLQERLRAPPVSRVILTDHANASIVQGPSAWASWGLRARASTTELMIGLPLMRALTVAQLEAVLAHEFAHAAQGHGRSARWLYLQRLRWGRWAQASLDASSSRPGLAWVSWLYGPCLRAMATAFSVCSHPLIRAQEFEADARAAQATSPSTLAEALTTVAVVGRYLGERFWPGAVRLVDSMSALRASHPTGQAGLQGAGFAPHANMAGMLREELTPALANAYLERALTAATALHDTHPCLHDRLQAIGQGPRLTTPRDARGSARLLGEALAALTHDFDRRWQADMALTRGRRRRVWLAEHLRLQGLEQRAQAGQGLDAAEAVERAQLTQTVHDDHDATLAQLQALYVEQPDDPLAAYGLGAALLARDEASGLAPMRRAMALDDLSIVHALEVMRDYHVRAGQLEEAESLTQQLQARVALEALAAHERMGITAHDTLQPHGLAPSGLEALSHSVALMPEVRRAWLARKQVRHLTNRDCFVLVFELRTSLELGARDRMEPVLRDLRAAIELPGETLVVGLQGASRAVQRSLHRQLKALGPAGHIR